MRKSGAILAALCYAALAGGAARADQPWLANQQANGFRLKGLLLPGVGEPLRLQDVAVGTCMLQATGTNAAPLTCVTAIPYSILTGTPTSLPPSGSASGDLGSTYPAPTVLAAEWSGTRLTFGALTDGALPKRSGTSLVAAVAGTDYQAPMSAADSTLVFPTANTVRGNYTGGTGINVSGNTISQTGSAGPASWTSGDATRRVFLVDGVNGNDANVGYLDGGASVFPISGGTIISTAKKTLAGLDAVFPRQGNGRSAEVIIAAGTYTDGLQVFLQGVNGYALNSPVIRGTSTNSTASATAFAGDVADLTYLGGVTVTGLNASGYNPTGTPTNQIVQLVKAGGGAPSFPSEPAAPLGWRFRCDAATTTTALRNAARQISIVTTDTLTLATTLPAVPVAADVCYVEQAGVVVGSTTLSVTGMGAAGNGVFRNTQIVGVNINGATTLSGATVYFGFAGIAGSLSANASEIAVDQTFLSQDHGTLTIGGGLHATGSFVATAGGMYNLHETVVETQALFSTPLFLNWKIGCVVGTGLFVGGTTANDNARVTSVGSETGQTISRILGGSTNSGGLTIVNSSLIVGSIQITGMGSNPGVHLNSSKVYQLINTQLTGSSGNTGVGLSFSSTTLGASTWALNGSTNTLTGTGGDVLLADGNTATWAQAGAGLWDTRANQIIGPTTWPISVLPAGTKLTGGSLTVPNLVGPGLVQVTSGGLFSVAAALAAIATSGSASDLITGTLPCARLGSFTGDLTNSACAMTIAGHAVSSAKFRQGVSESVVGVAGGSTADVADIQATGNGQCLQTVAGSVVWAACPSSSGGTVTAVTASDPLASSGGATPNLTLNIDSTLAVISHNLGRAAISGDGAIAAGSNTFALSNIPSDTTAAGDLLFTNIATPATPSAGHARCWIDSSTLNWVCKNASAVLNHGVQSLGAVANQFLTEIDNDGTVHQAAVSATGITSGTLPCAQLPALSGPVFSSGCITGITPNAISDADLRQGGQFTVIGRSAVTTGNVADIQAAGNGDVLRVAANVLSFGAIAESSVTNLVADLAARVTSVSGTSGQVNSTGGTTPVISLPSVGSPGTYGGPGHLIQEIVTDTQGRVQFVQAIPLGPPITMHWSWNFTGTLAANNQFTCEGGSNVGTETCNQYPFLTAMSSVTWTLNILNNNCISGSPTWTVTFYKNGSPTAVSTTQTCGTNGIISLGNTALSVAAGDLIGLVYNGTGFGSGQVTATVTAEFDP